MKQDKIMNEIEIMYRKMDELVSKFQYSKVNIIFCNESTPRNILTLQNMNGDGVARISY